MRKNAKRQGSAVLARAGARNMGTDIKEAAGAIFDFGKSALAEIMHRQAQASEYLLFEDRFEVVSSTGIRVVPYTEVADMKQKGERLSIILRRGSVSIKPYAHILSGRLRVPVGWSRNGLEVPYELLLDELSARAGVNIEHV